MYDELAISALFNLSKTIAAKLFEGRTYPWEVLPLIKEYILALGETLPLEKFDKNGDVWIAKTARVAPSALIEGPTIIDEGAEIRHCAYIRGAVIVGKNAVVGNSSELKNALLFDKVQTPHFNYVGDSVLGFAAHMGAGSVASNLKSDKQNVVIRVAGGACETGLRKVGAFLGDRADVGCNSVLCPGAVLGRDCVIYPVSRVRGYVPEAYIFKSEKDIIKKI
jgi:NDP-sugar pyrophosphorylase family protein